MRNSPDTISKVEGDQLWLGENSIARTEVVRLEDANRYYTEDLQAGTLTAGGYQRRALAWRVLCKLDLAIEDFSASLHFAPGNFFNYEQRGQLWKAKGDLDKSQADFAESARLKSEKR